MRQLKKHLILIAGCNGAGKTTASYTVLPDILNCKEFVNADEIAKGLSPFYPEHVAIQAGRLMISRINELLNNEISFAVETTLATKSYQNIIKRAKQKGYHVSLIFFWLNSVTLAKERVKFRVQEGGHSIPENVIERRYHNGLFNFFSLYAELVDSWQFYNNSELLPEIVSFSESNKISILNQELWRSIHENYKR